MKVTFYIVLIMFGMIGYSIADHDLSVKEEIRLEAKFTVIAMIGISHVDHCNATITSEEKALLEGKIEEFGLCLNNTIDKLFDALGDDIVQTDFRDLTKANKYLLQMCTVLSDGMKCYRDFEPTLQLCMSEKEKVMSHGILALVPIIIESACLKNGTQLLELLQHSDGVKCVSQMYNALDSNEVQQLIFSEHTNMASECIDYKRIQSNAFTQFDECSSDAFILAKPLFSHFCKLTKCQNYVNNLDCLTR